MTSQIHSESNLPLAISLFEAQNFLKLFFLNCLLKYKTSLEPNHLVTANYRIGPFGFLSLGTDDCPGNQALWDQLLGQFFYLVTLAFVTYLLKIHYIHCLLF